MPTPAILQQAIQYLLSFLEKNKTKATEQPSTRGIDRTVQFFWKSHPFFLWWGGRKGASKAEQTRPPILRFKITSFQEHMNLNACLWMFWRSELTCGVGISSATLSVVLLSQGYQQSVSLPDPEGLVHCRGWTAATSSRLACFSRCGCELL